jgi:HAD superfamily hydrolase (TIGR01509 family)
MKKLRFTAIFLDRDGTLSRFSPRKEIERDAAIGRIVGKPDLRLSEEDRMDVFWRVWKMPGVCPVNTLEREDRFWRLWFKTILQDHGCGSAECLGECRLPNADCRTANGLFEKFAFYRCMELYPETLGVLRELRGRGFKMGVISDTFPSLEESCRHMGIHEFFDSYTASSLVGAGKPAPRIFNAALRSLDVRAEESIFVDDTKDEADGAREQGFTAFHLDRQRTEADFEHWTIGNLGHLVQFIETRPG